MRAKQSTLDWLRSYYAAFDSGRFDEVRTYYADGLRNTYPKGEVMEGGDAIVAGAEQRMSGLDGIRHDLKNAWEEDDGTLIWELEVTYRRKDGQTIARWGVAVGHVADGRFTSQRLYVDQAGVWD